MKTSMSSFQNTLGDEFVEFGNHLIDNLKAINAVSAIIDLVLTGFGIMEIISLGLNFLWVTVLTTVLAISLFFFLRIFIKLIGKAINRAGEFFIKQSKTARFRVELIPKIRDYEKAEYTIRVSNKEWFENATDVSCSIGLGLTAQDFEDRDIVGKFEKDNKDKSFFHPFFLSGRWISENENIVNINKGKDKSIRFVSADVLKNELVVQGNSVDNHRERNTNLPPRKYFFPIVIRGEVKGGLFSSVFHVTCSYKGRHELDCSIDGKRVLKLKTIVERI